MKLFLICLCFLVTAVYGQQDDSGSCGSSNPLIQFIAEAPSGKPRPWTGMGVHANANRFWLGRPTRSRCPSNFYDCPPGRKTVFNPIDNATSLSLNNYAFHGAQRAYIGTFGALGFASPGNKGTPDDYYAGFGIKAGVLTFEDPENAGKQLLSHICPSDEGTTYIIYFNRVPLPAGCERANLIALPVFSAYKYY